MLNILIENISLLQDKIENEPYNHSKFDAGYNDALSSEN